MLSRGSSSSDVAVVDAVVVLKLRRDMVGTYSNRVGRRRTRRADAQRCANDDDDDSVRRPAVRTNMTVVVVVVVVVVVCVCVVCMLDFVVVYCSSIRKL
jgi:hypothetical protein